MGKTRGSPRLRQNSIVIDIGPVKPLARAPAALVQHLNVLFLGGQMSPAMRAILEDYVADVPYNDGGTKRVIEALYLITTSPEGALER